MLFNARERQALLQIFVSGEDRAPLRFLEAVAALSGEPVENEGVSARLTIPFGMVEGWSVQVELYAGRPPVALGSLVLLYKDADGVLIALDPATPDLLGRQMAQFQERTREQGYRWETFPCAIFSAGAGLGTSAEGVPVFAGELSTGAGVMDAVQALAKRICDEDLARVRGKRR